jgi:hypothetical protein
MNKTQRLQVEADARAAINSLYGANARNETLDCSLGGPQHEFDIYDSNVIIGGVSTSKYIVGNGSINTGGKDRAASELLWLSLWQGSEQRMHVLTCEKMASWLYKKYSGGKFPFSIKIYHYNILTKTVTEIGQL